MTDSTPQSRPDVALIQEALEYQEKHSLEGPLFPEAQEELRRLVEQLQTFREFYEAWWVVEQGVANFDLHSEAVTRLSEAHARVLRYASSPASRSSE